MIIVGARGFAVEVLEILHQQHCPEEVYFYDDVSVDLPKTLFDRFTIIRSKEEVMGVFENTTRKFTLGIGNPLTRYKLAQKFFEWGGELESTISPCAAIGHYGNDIGIGVNIMTGTVITNNIKIETGVLINLNCTIGHDTFIGKFSELSPGAHISGRCKIGPFSSIGTGAVLLPNTSIGKNVTIGAGAVVNKNIPDNCVAVGLPARVIKKSGPLPL